MTGEKDSGIQIASSGQSVESMKAQVKKEKGERARAREEAREVSVTVDVAPIAEQLAKDREAQREILTEQLGKDRESQVEASQKLAESIKKLERRLARGHKIDQASLEVQQEQLAQFAGGGYDAFVSAEEAQVKIDPTLFETQPQLWFRELNKEWQVIMRERVILMLAAGKKRDRGHVSLEAIAEAYLDVRVDRDALRLMWEKMPGFRIAMATMTEDLFQVRKETPIGVPRTEENEVWLMVLAKEARKEGGILENFHEYKEGLTGDLESYFEANPDKLETGKGGPSLTPTVAAKAAVAAAWNLLFVGNAIDSADQGDLSTKAIEELRRNRRPTQKEFQENATIGRTVRNGVIFGEQIRAMMLPADKSKGKTVREVGTEETWLGALGDYVAERQRHSRPFRQKIYHRTCRLIPQRLMASLFDLTTFTEKDKKGKEVEISLARKLCDHKNKRRVDPDNPRLFDYSDPGTIDFSELDGDLWPAYADTFDSAGKIYEAIGGVSPLETREGGGMLKWRQNLANALIKLRNTRLAPYFRDPEILVSCIAGSIGLHQFDDEYLLRLPEGEYDAVVTFILDDDRLFGGMPNGTRKRIFEAFSAQDYHTGAGVIVGTGLNKRDFIRRRAARARRRWSRKGQ